MATPTDPTMPLPTATGSDDDDDGDDDDMSSIAPVPAPTPNPSALPTPPLSSQTSSQTSIASPTSTEASASLTPAPEPENRGLSVGASAGIGVAVALAVILVLLGTWFFVRRRRTGLRRRRMSSKDSPPNETVHDLGSAEKGTAPEIREHRALGPSEMEAGGTIEKHASELASPVIPVEAAGDRIFAAELQGSEVPAKGTSKGNKERLFLDSPIDDDDGGHDIGSKSMDGKKPPC